MCRHIVVICNCSRRGIYSPSTISSVFPCSAILFVTPPSPCPCCNNSHTIVLVLSVTCEHVLMSPQFYSALAGIGCHLPAHKDIQLAIIPSLSPPWLITVLFLSLPPFFSHPSCYFLIFSTYGKKFILSFFFIIWQSQSSLLLFFLFSPSLPSLPKLKGSSFFTVLFSNT